MEMNVRDDKKIVEIWLTNAEKNDPVLRESLKDVYAKNIWWQCLSPVPGISISTPAIC